MKATPMTVEEFEEQVPVLPLLLTPAQAGEFLGLSEVVVRALIKDGSLKAIRISKRVNRISRAECERFAAEGALS